MKTTKNYFLLLFLTLGLGIFMASCSSSDDSSSGNEDDLPPPPKNEFIISANKTTIKINETVNFTAKISGTIIKDIQFIINDIGIDSENYTFTEVGDFTVQARKVTGEMSNKLTISVFKDDEEINNATKFAYRVLIEDFTGAWCGYCPRVADKIEQLEARYPNRILPLAIHNSKSSNVNNGGHDPFDFFKSQRLRYESGFTMTGYPAAFINRDAEFENNFSRFESYMKDFSTIGIKIDSEIYVNDGIVKVGIKFGENYPQGVKYAVFLAEDGLLFRQSNYLKNLYKHLTTIDGFLQNFEHNNTLVGITDAEFRGSEIASTVTVKGGEYINNNIYIRHHAKDLNNAKIVVVVTDMEGKALNAISAKINTNTNYEIIR